MAATVSYRLKKVQDLPMPPLCLFLSLSLISLILTIQPITPNNQTHKHTCSFYTIQKLKLDLIVALRLH